MRYGHAWRAGLLLGALLVLTLVPALPAETPSKPAAPVTLPEPLTREAVRELLARLSDAEVRQLLLAQLDRAVAQGGSPSGRGEPGGMAGMVGMMMMDKEADRVHRRLLGVLGAATRLPEALPAAVGRLTEGRGPGHLLRVALLLAVMLAIGWGAERLFGRLTRDVRRRLTEVQSGGVAAVVAQLGLRLILDSVALLVFAVAAVASFFVLYHGHEPTRQLVMATLAGVVLVRLASLVARFLLAPRDPAARPLARPLPPPPRPAARRA